MRRFLLLSTVVVVLLALFAQTGQVVRAAIDRDALQRRFERICALDSPDYDRQACDTWFTGLTQQEQDYLVNRYINVDGPDEDAAATYPIWYLAEHVDGTRYRGFGYVEKSRLDIPRWQWWVWMKWCQNTSGGPVGCFHSWDEWRTWTVWDYHENDAVASRDTAVNSSWSRLTWTGHFTGSFPGLGSLIHCYPRIRMAVVSQTAPSAPDIAYRVDGEAQRC